MEGLGFLGGWLQRALEALDTLIEAVTFSCVALILLTLAFFLSDTLSDHTGWYAGLALLCLTLPELVVGARSWREIRSWLGSHSEDAEPQQPSERSKHSPVVPNIVSLAFWLVAVLASIVSWQVLITKAIGGETGIIYLEVPASPTRESVVLPTAASPSGMPSATPVASLPTPASRTVEVIRVTDNRCGENEATTIVIDLTLPPDQLRKYWLLRSDDMFPAALVPQGPPTARRLERPHLEFQVLTPICDRGYRVSLIECTPEGSAVIEAIIHDTENSLRAPPAGCTDLGQQFRYVGK